MNFGEKKLENARAWNMDQNKRKNLDTRQTYMRDKK